MMNYIEWGVPFQFLPPIHQVCKDQFTPNFQARALGDNLDNDPCLMLTDTR